MSVYTKKINGLGYVNYRRDKRFVKTADVPGNIVDLLKEQDSVDDENIKVTAPYKRCVFCKEETRLSRTINQQTIAICKKHFYSKTIGQIAQQVRLNEEETHEEDQQG